MQYAMKTHYRSSINETNASNVPNCPFDIEDFIKENSVIDSIRPHLTVLLKEHYSKILPLFSKHPKKSGDFTKLFKDVNEY